MTIRLGIILAVTATVVYNLGFIAEKRALDRLPRIEAHRVGRLIRTLFTAPAWLAGFAAICCGLALQVVVLSLLPLSLAQPLQASGVVVTIVFAWLVLRERLGRAELACVAIIAAAVVLLSLSAGSGPGSQPGTHAANGAIAVAAIPVALVVAAAYRWAYRLSARPGRQQRARQHLASVCYGLCAGLVYGYAGLAVKALSAAVFAPPAGHAGAAGHVVAAATSPYLYVLLASTAVGMCLFQVALQRGRASIVMPVSLVMSTGYLVVVGSLLFHERLPASGAALAMRVTGGVAAVTVPVILAIATERRARVPGKHERPARARKDPQAATNPQAATDPKDSENSAASRRRAAAHASVRHMPKGGAAFARPARAPRL